MRLQAPSVFWSILKCSPKQTSCFVNQGMSRRRPAALQIKEWAEGVYENITKHQYFQHKCMLYTKIFDGIHNIHFRVHIDVYCLHVHIPSKMYALYVQLQFHTVCNLYTYSQHKFMLYMHWIYKDNLKRRTPVRARGVKSRMCTSVSPAWS